MPTVQTQLSTAATFIAGQADPQSQRVVAEGAMGADRLWRGPDEFYFATLPANKQAAEAVAVLLRIPVAQSQNVIVLDKTGAYATVFLSPERAPLVSRSPVCANHQDSSASGTESRNEANSMAREQSALFALESPRATLAKITEVFFTAPIYSRDASSPTVYSAVYRPAALTVDYLWPGNVMTQRIGSFKTGQYVHDYGTLASSTSLFKCRNALKVSRHVQQAPTLVFRPQDGIGKRPK